MDNKIDFVITWVDGNDVEWQMEKAKYSAEGADVRNARYRDWDQLKYWFRAVEKYAPWVNKIHFVTYGHLPNWLDTSHPKLHIVKHSDFIPEQYLPVFNSTAIEVHLHRIPELTEQFVYFNDDYYLMQHCKPEDFFKNGKPSDNAIFIPVIHHDNEMYYYHLYNDYSVYIKYVSKKTILRNIFKYINLKYGSSAFSNLLHILVRNLYLKPLHLPTPLLRSSMEKMWMDNGSLLEKTARTRFRQVICNSLEAVRGYQLITGNFHPDKKKGVILDTRKVEHVKQVIENCKYKLMCLSDNTEDDTFENDKIEINSSFEKVFPIRSSFEHELEY